MNPAQFHPTHSRKTKNGAWVPEWNSPAVLAFRECPVMKCRCIFFLPSLPLLVSFDRLAVFHRGGIVAFDTSVVDLWSAYRGSSKMQWILRRMARGFRSGTRSSFSVLAPLIFAGCCVC